MHYYKNTSQWNYSQHSKQAHTFLSNLFLSELLSVSVLHCFHCVSIICEHVVFFSVQRVCVSVCSCVIFCVVAARVKQSAAVPHSQQQHQ